MQTKKDSHLEVSANQISGVIGGYLIVYFIFPLFQHLEQYIVAGISTIIFFIFGYCRAYSWRRYFNKKFQKVTPNKSF
ncbi:MAG: DUF7220 family protein [Paraclostridium sp.]